MDDPINNYISLLKARELTINSRGGYVDGEDIAIRRALEYIEERLKTIQ